MIQLTSTQQSLHFAHSPVPPPQPSPLTRTLAQLMGSEYHRLLLFTKLLRDLQNRWIKFNPDLKKSKCSYCSLPKRKCGSHSSTRRRRLQFCKFYPLKLRHIYKSASSGVFLSESLLQHPFKQVVACFFRSCLIQREL